ncbi:hypothetical protein DAETH_16780 [Deinococcus aetherius]|uniref:DinB-like domain-containing protein n=1 Tax=Deinococcus aetherius TaxID=200252 RepID=A0ABM8AD89_9DEIO|nr:ClbS/DfsB family four-helix bundle protein [Deinococcus aetherius]BDP41709.1 hypothetical protein DAETH_16780 [Deinococcus aetherius]
MHTPHSRAELLARIAFERQLWQDTVEAIGPRHALAPGAMGRDWTFLDLVAHLTTWWRWEVANVALIRRGERPSPPPSREEVQVINAWTQLTNRDRAWKDVTRDAAETWDQLAAGVAALPEQDLLAVGGFEWLGDEGLGQRLLVGFLDHWHVEHEPKARALLDDLTARG